MGEYMSVREREKTPVNELPKLLKVNRGRAGRFLQRYEAYKCRVTQGVEKSISVRSVGVLEFWDMSQRHVLLDVQDIGLPMNELQSFVPCKSWLGWTVKCFSRLCSVSMSLLSVHVDLVSWARSRRILQGLCGECTKVLLQQGNRREWGIIAERVLTK